MNTILKSLRNLFSNEKVHDFKKLDLPPKISTSIVEKDLPVEKELPNVDSPAESAKRTRVKAPIIASGSSLEESDEILIKAEPSAMGDQCKFMVNRNLLEGYSWMFSNFERAAGSPIAEAVFSVEDVETVLVYESTLTVTRQDKTKTDWRPLTKEVGAAIRQVLRSSSFLIADKIISEIPPQDEIRKQIQEVINNEVNPGVAGHGGNITLLGVKGNTVTIQMGGGCQGCSAADMTLKAGIHTAFRKAVPAVGAILDETDHAAGLNPYYS